MSIQVTIKNFQSIEEVSFSIDGYTVIEGPSDIGKSAVMRAIEALLSNDRGDYFIRRGTKECYVMLHFVSEGFKIEWFKKIKKGGYYVINEDYEHPLEKLNGAVPEQIIDFGISEIPIKNANDRGRVHPQICSDQHNTLFMIYESPQVRAELVSEISEVTKISKALKFASKDLKSRKKEIKDKEKELKKVKTRFDIIKALNYESLADDVTSLHNTIQEGRKALTTLQSTQSAYLLSTSRLRGLREIPELPDKGDIQSKICELDSLSSLDSLFKECLTSLNLLQDIPSLQNPLPLKNEIEELDKVQTVYSKFLENCRIIDLDIPVLPNTDLVDQLNLLVGLYDLSLKYSKLDDSLSVLDCIVDLGDLSSLEEEISTLSDISNLSVSYKGLTEDIYSYDSDVEIINGQLIQLDEELSAFDKCPFCNSTLEGGFLEHKSHT